MEEAISILTFFPPTRISTSTLDTRHSTYNNSSEERGERIEMMDDVIDDPKPNNEPRWSNLHDHLVNFILNY